MIDNRINRLQPPLSPQRRADFIIVGAGTAGCILANRLSSDPACEVILIEAGGQDDAVILSDPQLWPMLIGSPYDWGYATEPQRALDGRVLAYPRGKVLGGSSSINALGHQRGDPAIFDGWASAGCKGWSFSDLLPFFKLSEAFEGGADAFRGGSGPIPVIRPAPGGRSVLAEAFVKAAQDCGHAFNPDFNGTTMEGVAWNQLAMQGGARASSAFAYLHPVLGRPNLTVLTSTRVLELLFQGDQCRGVRIEASGRVDRLHAAETLLCAGAVDSPRLLMLSGVGRADALRALDIKTRVHAPEVGRNLQDHPLSGVVYEAKGPLVTSHYNHGEAILFAHSGFSSNGAPDIQIMAVDAPFTTPETGPAPPDSYSLVTCLMQPDSCGSVTLRSSDPRAAAKIDPNYLSTEADMARYLAAVDLTIAIGAENALGPLRKLQCIPGPSSTDRDARLAYIRKAASPFFHPVGTCRMGDDQDSVVDLALKVRGVRGLRVIDASVIPTIPNAMPNAAIAAIAEKTAVLI